LEKDTHVELSVDFDLHHTRNDINNAMKNGRATGLSLLSSEALIEEVHEVLSMAFQIYTRDRIIPHSWMMAIINEELSIK